MGSWELRFVPGPARLALKGGTHLKWASPVHFLGDVQWPALSKTGLECRVHTETWGWYPEGGGTARARVQPVNVLRSLTPTERPDLNRVDLLSVVSNLPVQIARWQQDRDRKRLKDARIPLRIETAKAPSPGKGTFVFLLAQYGNIKAGFSSLGEIDKPAEQVAHEAVDAFLAHHRNGPSRGPTPGRPDPPLPGPAGPGRRTVHHCHLGDNTVLGHGRRGRGRNHRRENRNRGRDRKPGKGVGRWGGVPEI